VRANFEERAIHSALVVVPAVALLAWVASVKLVNRLVAPALAASNLVNIAGQESTAECPVAVVDDSHVTGYLSEEPHYLEKDYCRFVVDSNSHYPLVHSHNLQISPGSLSILPGSLPHTRNNEI
jgi:hypothetical protein